MNNKAFLNDRITNSTSFYSGIANSTWQGVARTASLRWQEDYKVTINNSKNKLQILHHFMAELQILSGGGDCLNLIFRFL
jgi:hypothetical protein